MMMMIWTIIPIALGVSCLSRMHIIARGRLHVGLGGVSGHEHLRLRTLRRSSWQLNDDG